MNNTLSFYVQRYFSSYLIGRHNYGKNTVSSYRDTFKLLLVFLGIRNQKKKNIILADVDKDCISRFLDWLETERGNSSATRNVRLAHYNGPQKSDHGLGKMREHGMIGKDKEWRKQYHVVQAISPGI